MTKEPTNTNKNVEQIIEMMNAQESKTQVGVKDFVQDSFFEKGHLWLKIRQVLLNLVFLAVLIFPIIILFNSILGGQLSDHLYFWDYQDGFELTDYLRTFILLAFVFVLVASLAFLYRNNYREQKVYPEKKTYDEKKLEARKEILNEMYTKRFGEKDFRETTKFYAVEGEQNLSDHMVSDLFKEGGVEIK